MTTEFENLVEWDYGWYPGKIYEVETNIDLGWYPGKIYKHLPGMHNQEDHAGKAGERVLAPPVLSSMSKDLKGKMLKGKVITQVLKAKDKSLRIVEFNDGSQKLIPSPILGKLAYGPGSGSDVGKLFKSVKGLHSNGFVSYAQAAYLYNEDRKNFYLVMGKARAGKRRWNDEFSMMEDTEGAPEFKHLPDQHNQSSHAGVNPRLSSEFVDLVKQYLPEDSTIISAEDIDFNGHKGQVTFRTHALNYEPTTDDKIHKVMDLDEKLREIAVSKGYEEGDLTAEWNEMTEDTAYITVRGDRKLISDLFGESNFSKIKGLLSKHLPGQHDQQNHSGKEVANTYLPTQVKREPHVGIAETIRDKVKRYAPAVVAGLGAGAAILGTTAAIKQLGKVDGNTQLEDDVIKGFKNDIDAKLVASEHMRQQADAVKGDRTLQAKLWAKAVELEADHHEMKHMKDWPRQKILDYLKDKSKPEETV